MANMNLTRYESDDELEFFIDENDGEIYATQSATARMCDKNESTIRSWVTSRNVPTIMAEVLTPRGLQSSRLLHSDSVMDALERFNPALAKRINRGGIKTYMYGLAGYQLKLESPVQESAKEVIETEYNPNPKSMFSSVFDAIIEGRKRGIEDAIVIKLMAGDRRISRETAEWLMETEVKTDHKMTPSVQPESDLTSALSRQSGTRRGRKREDCVRSTYPKVYLRYASNKWYAKYAKPDGTDGKVPGLFDTDVEAYRAQQRFLKQS